MPPSWPLFSARGPLRKADILLDTTCFSTTDFDNVSTDGRPNSADSSPLTLYLHTPTAMTKKGLKEEQYTEATRKTALSNSAIDIQARYNHPTFPSPTFLTTLLQGDRFRKYILDELPSYNDNLPLPMSTGSEPLRKEINATIANTLLNAVIPAIPASTDWIRTAVFPDKLLPVPFNDECLDDVLECWDKSTQKFSHLPENMMEHAVQDWLNHLAHSIGVKHGLIKKGEPEELVNTNADEDIDTYNRVEEQGVVIANAADRSFSMVSHMKAPSGGYRLRKPDLILVSRNLRHFLNNASLRPRWHHVEAIVEVSSSAPRNSILQQILEKAALMFETQPFRRFVIGLAFRGVGENLEYCFMLVDRAGVCLTGWTNTTKYEGITLARIIFALSYGSPELLGVDTSMTTNFSSGIVTKIRVQNQEFNVIKHIHASLILFGRGTHVFLVQDQDKNFHILKDAWLLSSHGSSEIDILSTISNTLKNDPSKVAQKYQSIHSRFVVGEEIGDSTHGRRGRLATKDSPERVHRRTVTGPIGDPITSFRSRKEFVEVFLDCVNWLEYLHNNCGIVHGDLSINNIVIHRSPSLPKAPASVIAPSEGVDENIPVTGVIIDYDYAHESGSILEKTSGTLPFMTLASLDKENRGKYIHGPAEDFEALLHTILGIVTFTAGPCGQVRPPTEHVPLARWYNEVDREQLHKDKIVDLIGYDREIEKYIPKYWKPFSPYLRRLVLATWPHLNGYSPSVATADKFRDILKEALEYFSTNCPETPCNYARITRKHGISTRDEERYPYKYVCGNDRRLPRPAVIKQRSEWKDSVDA